MSPEQRTTTDVVIAGGGPVGIFLGILLLQAGVSVRVLERRSQRSGHSRAIGIHPPALQVLASAGVVDQLVGEGTAIRRGEARSRGRLVATLPFEDVSPIYPFVLALQQCRTDDILERRLLELDPDALVRGVQVFSMDDDGDGVVVRAVPESGEGSPREFRARIGVASDGAKSVLRDRMDVGVRRTKYPDTYLMGDFADAPESNEDRNAVLYLEPDGIVESFPLPGGIRRWVMRTRSLDREPTATSLAKEIRRRTGVVLDPTSNTMLSAFEVRSQLVTTMIHGRTVLLGDAAHEISPIGGQGMNLGWLDAADLAPLITASLRAALSGPARGRALASFDSRRRRAAVVASRQAHLNMMLGRPLPARVLAARNRIMAAAIGAGPVGLIVARRFTMH
ncbi:FAD-dependent oxidoreductase [Arthrobacter roseus]|uniref:FAD-dependent oxidoreductase n=1 Tax=Arthrobacter roseus TaxID=136274 RepID=UPI0019654F38|nr:NAD(P)/FAD-dependent oxidoreductase [Arthrobacter roseus]MBM7847783.1 2-polyprenyl-6-methoxyphenol hydroxylase-like FAD-dependent oxidoreductase [Arthrobacter roseus]